MEISDIGLIGLAVMGENLALNLESKGYTVSVYNRVHPDRESVVTRFVEGRGKGKRFHGTYTIEEFVESIRLPRKIMLMVKAGDPVDELIGQLLPWLSPGDVIIDGGNSDYHDTERRVKMLEEKGLYFIGAGISGGAAVGMGLGEAIHDLLPRDGLGLVERGLDLLLHGREHGQQIGRAHV